MLQKRSLLLGPPRKLLEMSLFQSVAQNMGLEIRDSYHPIRHQILPRNSGLTFITPKIENVHVFSRETLSARGGRIAR